MTNAEVPRFLIVFSFFSRAWKKSHRKTKLISECNIFFLFCSGAAICKSYRCRKTLRAATENIFENCPYVHTEPTLLLARPLGTRSAAHVHNFEKRRERVKVFESLRCYTRSPLTYSTEHVQRGEQRVERARCGRNWISEAALVRLIREEKRWGRRTARHKRKKPDNLSCDSAHVRLVKSEGIFSRSVQRIVDNTIVPLLHAAKSTWRETNIALKERGAGGNEISESPRVRLVRDEILPGVCLTNYVSLCVCLCVCMCYINSYVWFINSVLHPAIDATAWHDSSLELLRLNLHLSSETKWSCRSQKTTTLKMPLKQVRQSANASRAMTRKRTETCR